MHAKSSRTPHFARPSAVLRGVSLRSGSRGAAGAAVGGADFGSWAQELADKHASRNNARATPKGHFQLGNKLGTCRFFVGKNISVADHRLPGFTESSESASRVHSTVCSPPQHEASFNSTLPVRLNERSAQKLKFGEVTTFPQSSVAPTRVSKGARPRAPVG